MSSFSAYRGKRVLVTGCTGFKGSWLCHWLSALGAQVHGLALAPASEPSMFEATDLRSLVEFHEGDVRDFAFVERVLRESAPDFVFHLAAQAIVRTAYEDPVGTFATNVIGSAHVLEALRRAGRPVTAVMVTSDKCYENVEWVYGYRETDALGGKDPYSASKAAAEMAIRSWSQSFFAAADSPVRVVAVRAGNVVGGGDWAAARIVPDAARAWSRGEAVVIRSPKATRPWQHVLEPLSGYLLAGLRVEAREFGSGEAFNFGPAAEQAHSVLELLGALAREWQGLGPEPIRVEAASFHEAGLLKLNCDKALALLGWKPALRFEETARLTARWYAHFYADGKDIAEFTRAQIREYSELALARHCGWTQA